MGHIEVITHVLTIDPNFLQHPSCLGGAFILSEKMWQNVLQFSTAYVH